MSWTIILLLAAGSYGLKVFGVFVLGGRATGTRVSRVTSLLPASLIAALVVVMTVATDERLVIDARLAGVAVGAVATWRQAPLVVVLVVATAATAIVRSV